MTEKRTAMTPIISTGSNVQYQLQLIYNITKRTKDSVTMDIDVRVHYLREWSSNGAWVRIENSRRCLNPRHIRGYYDWYASTQNTTRVPQGAWLKGKTFKTTPTATRVLTKVGFSNQLWAEGTYHYQEMNIPIPKYVSPEPEVETPSKPPTGFENGVPKEYVTVTAPKYFKDEIDFSWTVAPLSDRYDIEGHKLENGEWKYLSKYSTLLQISTYRNTIAKPGDQYRIAVFPSYDGVRGEPSYSNIITRNIRPTQVALKTADSPVISTDDIVLSTSENSHKADQELLYALRVYNIKNELIHEVDYQPSPRFKNAYRYLNGQEVYIQWSVSDGIEQTEWSEKHKVLIGKEFSKLGKPSAGQGVFEEGLVLRIPAILLDGRPMHDIVETIDVKYTIYNEQGKTEGSCKRHYRLYGGVIKKYLISDVWEDIMKQVPNLQTDYRYRDAKIDLEVTQSSKRYQRTHEPITLTNPHPRIHRTFQPKEQERYSMDKTEPIIHGEFNVMLGARNFHQKGAATISVFLRDRSQGHTQELYSETFTGDSYDKTLLFNIDELKNKPGGSYEIIVRAKTSSPRQNHYEEIVPITATDRSFSTPDPVEINYSILNSRLSFISNDIDINQALVRYELGWNKNKAFEITGSLVGIDENGVEQFRGELKEPLLLFDRLIGKETFKTSLTLGELQEGDVWTFTMGELLNQEIKSIKTGSVRDNTFKFKMIMQLEVRELFRDTPNSTRPNSALESWSTTSMLQEYMCDTHEPPYYSHGAKFTFKRTGGHN